jgi:site-specific recombinase XerD
VKVDIESYLSELRARNSSPHTIRAYRQELAKLSEHFDALSNLSRQSYRALMATLQERGLSRTSLVRAQAVHRSFFDWLESEGKLRPDQNPTAGVLPMRRPKKLPRALSEESVKTLLDGPLLGGTWPERDRALLEVAYSTGCRACELAAMNLSDLRDDDTLLARGKGRKERIVFLHQRARQALDAYIESRAALKLTIPASFVSRKKRTRLTTRSIGRIFRNLAMANGLNPDDFHPHAFRHAMTSHMLDRGADLLSVKEILGHERISTTCGYAAASMSRTLDVYDAAMSD